MFGAVVCPRCRKGFAVDLEHRSSTCPQCGRQVQTRRMKNHFTSASASLTAQEYDPALGVTVQRYQTATSRSGS